MKNKTIGVCMALMAAGFAMASETAVAQELTEIVVESAPPHVQNVPGPAGATVHTQLISVKYRVNYADLDLTTHSGAAALEQRISDAAKKGCAEIDRAYPLTAPPRGDTTCFNNAREGGMVKARAAIAAAEAKAQK